MCTFYVYTIYIHHHHLWDALHKSVVLCTRIHTPVITIITIIIIIIYIHVMGSEALELLEYHYFYRKSKSSIKRVLPTYEATITRHKH